MGLTVSDVREMFDGKFVNWKKLFDSYFLLKELKQFVDYEFDKVLFSQKQKKEYNYYTTLNNIRIRLGKLK